MFMFSLLQCQHSIWPTQQDVSFQYTLCFWGQNHYVIYVFIAAIAIPLYVLNKCVSISYLSASQTTILQYHSPPEKFGYVWLCGAAHGLKETLTSFSLWITHTWVALIKALSESIQLTERTKEKGRECIYLDQ